MKRLTQWIWPFQSSASSKREHLTLSSSLRELTFVLGVTFAYFLTRGLIRGRAGVAFANARQILSFEHTLHIEPEYVVQAFAIQHAWLVQAANTFYIVGHPPNLTGQRIGQKTSQSLRHD